MMTVLSHIEQHFVPTRPRGRSAHSDGVHPESFGAVGR